MSSLNIALAFVRGAPNRAQRGLYQGAVVQFGNQYSFSNRCTRRSWKPNANYNSLWSDVLQRKIRVRCTARALKTIDKYGGIDNYLTRMHPSKIDSEIGMLYREQILDALASQQAAAGEAAQVVGVAADAGVASSVAL